MNMSYDYSELIQELYEELHDGALDLDEKIQILREPEKYIETTEDSMGKYYPIIDWYYSEEEMKDILEIDENDNEQDIKEVKELKVKYEQDRYFLHEIVVEDCLNEMKKWDAKSIEE